MDRIGPQSSAERRQEEAIESVLRLSFALEQAWNNRDAQAFTSLFDEDADLRFSRRKLIQGRASIRHFLEKEVFSKLTDALWQSSFMKTIRFITDDVAIGDGIIRMVEKLEDREEVKFEAGVSVLVTKRKGQWFVSALRLTKSIFR